MHHPYFEQMLGRFFAAWSMVDLLTCYAIAKQLRLTDVEGHILTAGMTSFPKFRLLRNLLRRSDHPNKGKLLDALNRIQNASKRDTLAHSYILSRSDSVVFIERPGGFDYTAKEHRFSAHTFYDHVKSFWNAARDFEVALGVPNEEIAQFGHAAFSANLKAPKSADRPSDK
jgi:hypothetical protein